MPGVMPGSNQVLKETSDNSLMVLFSVYPSPNDNNINTKTDDQNKTAGPT